MQIGRRKARVRMIRRYEPRAREYIGLQYCSTWHWSIRFSFSGTQDRRTTYKRHYRPMTVGRALEISVPAIHGVSNGARTPSPVSLDCRRAARAQ